jgi:coenzyme F420 hydrogenase subunit beta
MTGNSLEDVVVRAGLCTGCGACVALCGADQARMEDTPAGPVPRFSDGVPDAAARVCPALKLSYPDLYRAHYGALPSSWLLGMVEQVRTGYAADEAIRRRGASGGVLTATLCYLLETDRVDAVLAVRQGVSTAEQAGVVVCENRDQVIACAQSVYVPVSVLDVLRTIDPGKRYAITCLPDQAAALRALQREGFAPALAIAYVVGPYTGTALYPEALRAFMRSHGVKPDDAITSLQWRAGEWPGYLEIKTASGRVLQSKKVYYNYLIPFFITRNSLQNMDFANEFCDLSVGDAWSPKYEALGQGFAVYTTRSKDMETIVSQMVAEGVISGEVMDPLEAAAMHGHMLDFKRRGGYLRNQWRRWWGLPAPDFGMRPEPLPWSRRLVEGVLILLFAVCGTRLARAVLARIPERWIGPVFNKLRLGWKKASKPTKRKGLAELRMVETGKEAA